MVGLNQTKCCLISVVCFSLFTALSASNIISDGIFGSSNLNGRRLLQAAQPCPIDFASLDYKIVTSACKGPAYLPRLCCPAFKELACPYANYLGDLSNDCARTMLSRINFYGRYPPNLFRGKCVEDNGLLKC